MSCAKNFLGWMKFDDFSTTITLSYIFNITTIITTTYLSAIYIYIYVHVRARLLDANARLEWKESWLWIPRVVFNAFIRPIWLREVLYKGHALTIFDGFLGTKIKLVLVACMTVWLYHFKTSSTWHIITSKIPIYNIGYHGCELRQVQISHEIWPILRKIHGRDVEWRIIIPTNPTAPVVQWLNGFPGDGLGGTGRGWRPHDHQGHPWRLTKDIKIYDYMIVIPVTDQKQRKTRRFFGFCRVVEFIWCRGVQHFRKVNISNSIEVSPDRMEYESVQGISG